MKIQFLLYAIILGLVLNLLADMIWRYIPRTNQHIDKIVTGALISICILLLIFYKEEYQRPESSQQIKYVGRVIDSKTNASIGGAKVSLNFQGTPRVVHTDSEGIYRFAINLTGNEHAARVRVEVAGFQS